MGYEVKFSYHEEIEKGEYNTEEVKTKFVKVGDPYEDVPLGLVAGKIMAQLARRSILVVGVEVFEYTKKQISYKETPDGILIKNRKFSFDEGEVIAPGGETQIDEVQEDLLKQLLDNPSLLNNLQQKLGLQKTQPVAPKINPSTAVSGSYSVIREEVYNPADKIFLDDAKRRNLAFTLGKKYPIVSERASTNKLAGMLYTVIDDNGKRTTMSDKFFTPVVSMDKQFREDFKPIATSGGGGTVVTGDGLQWSGLDLGMEDKLNVSLR